MEPLTIKKSQEHKRHSFSKIILWTQSSSLLHFDVLIGDKHKVQCCIKENIVDLNNLDKWGRTPLFNAVLKNNLDILEILVKAEPQLMIKDFYGRSILHYAAEKGYNGCLKVILQALDKQKCHTNEDFVTNLFCDINGITPLHLAAKVPSSKCTSVLLKYFLQFFTKFYDETDNLKRSPLHWAAAHGCDEPLGVLVKSGSNGLLPDCNGKLPVHYAALSIVDSSKACFQTLLTLNNVNIQDFEGATPLHFAVISGIYEKIYFMMTKYRKMNVDINTGDNQNRTPLHYACASGSESIVNLLISSGADINRKDNDGNTPLHFAVLHNHKNVTKILAVNPGTLEIYNNKGESPIHWAAAVGANASLLFMSQHDGSILKKDGIGATPLHIAAKKNNTSTVDILLKLKVPINTRSTYGCTPLHFAAEGGAVKVVKQLLSEGASLDDVDFEGRTALHFSVIGGHLHLSQLLIESGISLECQDIYGQTPLHLAALFDFTDVLCLLLENRANMNALDNQQKVALHVACSHGNYRTVKSLLEFGAYPNFIDSTDNRFTPLDYCSSHPDIANLLKEFNGVCSIFIFNFAALVIQKWFQGLCLRKKLKNNNFADQRLKFVKEKAFNSVKLDHLNGTFEQIVEDSTLIRDLAKQVSENLNVNIEIDQEDQENIDEDYGSTCSSNSDKETFDVVDMSTLPRYPSCIVSNIDGSISRELEFCGIYVTLPSEEQQERVRKAVTNMEVCEISSSEEND